MTQTPVILTPLPRLPMTKRLRELLTETTGKPWEIKRIPRVPMLNEDKTPVTPKKLVPAEPVYGILYPLFRTYSGPQYADQHADVTWWYQATIATLRGDQAEVFADKVIRTVVGRVADRSFAYDLDLPGMRVIDRNVSDENPSEGPGDSTTGIGTTDIRFSLTVTPDHTPIV